jgi:hypothetical protein
MLFCCSFRSARYNIYCSIEVWGSQSGGHEIFYILGYNTLYSDESQTTFRRNILLAASGSKSKLSKKPRLSSQRLGFCFLASSCWFWRENVIKIVPVQVPTKLEMWQKLCRLCFRYNLCIASMCRSYSNNRPYAASLHAGPACLRPYVIDWGRGTWGLDSRYGRAKN